MYSETCFLNILERELGWPEGCRYSPRQSYQRYPNRDRTPRLEQYGPLVAL
jgi:hypothetical protein